MTDEDISHRAAREVRELHALFQAWFTGRVPKSSECFARVELAWPTHFTMVTPQGERVESAALLESTFEQHGNYPSQKIRIEKLSVTHSFNPGIAVVVYEEWHVDESETEGRLCSATLVTQPEAPNGVQWLHIHESVLRGEADAP